MRTRQLTPQAPLSEARERDLFDFTFTIDEVIYRQGERRFLVRYSGVFWVMLPAMEYTPRPGDVLTLYYREPTPIGFPYEAIRLNDGPLVPRTNES